MKELLKNKTGFTLVELLVVISIIGILTIISASSYRTAQIKGRDAVRKSDLDSMSKSLMVYYNDVGSFPNFGLYDLFGIGSKGGNDFGFTGPDGTIYMRKTPRDPTNDNTYQYVYKVSDDFKSFNLFANLENKSDSQCLMDGSNGKWSVDGKYYCYGVSSPNAVIKNW